MFLFDFVILYMGVILWYEFKYFIQKSSISVIRQKYTKSPFQEFKIIQPLNTGLFIWIVGQMNKKSPVFKN